MSKTSLKDILDRLGLKQTELARLIDVSPRTVTHWASGEAQLPGPVAAYLRVLQQLPPKAIAAELQSVKRRSKMIDEGLYNLEYRSNVSGEAGDVGSALAVLRNGKILGSDRWGAVFMGSYDFDPETELNSVHLRLHVPADGTLITGFSAGPEGATIEIVGSFARASPVTTTVTDVGGHPVEVTMTYLGALPN